MSSLTRSLASGTPTRFTMTERGRFYHIPRAEQLISFVGLQWGRITPSDLDCCIDFGGQAFVYVEVKYDDTPILRGQQLLLERLCELAEKSNLPAIAILAKHQINVGMVVLAEAEVVEFYWKGGWREPSRCMTVRQAIKDFLVRHRIPQAGAA